MNAQDIYLSPRQIISYLMEFDKKLPEPRKDYYTPVLNQSPITASELNQEAKRMMDYVGLTSYVPKCNFCILEKGKGGNTKCCNSNLEVEINISSKYQNNIEATLAVLAHEICHKYLYVHGLFNPIEVINEIFTDLCTMYVGFGKIIINGYITERKTEIRTDKYIQTSVDTNYLGYLKFPIYRRTLNIIRLVLWDESAADVMASEDDPLLLDTFKRWISEKDKKSLSRNVLINSGKDVAELTKNSLLLERLLGLVNSQQLEQLKSSEAQLYNEDWFASNGAILLKSRFSVFNSIYQSIVLESNASEHSICIKNVNRYIRHLIMLIYEATGIKLKDFLRTSVFSCPFCGEKHKSEKFIDKTALIKCPKCHKRFYLDCEEFDLMNTKNDYDHFKDELIMPIRKGYLDSLENEKKKSYQNGFNAGQKSESDKYKNKIDKLPFWLKLLIGKKLD